MIELENPQIEPVEEAGTYAKYEAGPLQAGYGVTLGNALRRVMLSSLDGAAVTSIQIRDIYQEFSTIPGVKEDVTQIVLNVKKLRLKSFATHPVQLRLIKSGAGAVTAADIAESADVEIVNPELVLMTIDTDDVTIEVDLTVERGVGYLGAERAEALPIGVIAIDAIFTPVRKVNYWVESMRVGQMTNYDKLTIEIETDGTLTPEEALSHSAEILVNQFRPFVSIGMAAVPGDQAAGGVAQLPPNMLDMPIEELDLPMRAYNSLKRNNIVKVGQLLQLKDDDLLRMRNFGKKSLDEMKERLRMRGFIVPETESDGLEDGTEDEPFERRGRGIAVASHRIGGRKLSRKTGPADGPVQEPDRLGPALRARPDDRGEGQGDPRPRRADDHPRQAERPRGSPRDRRGVPERAARRQQAVRRDRAQVHGPDVRLHPDRQDRRPARRCRTDRPDRARLDHIAWRPRGRPLAHRLAGTGPGSNTTARTLPASRCSLAPARSRVNSRPRWPA